MRCYFLTIYVFMLFFALSASYADSPVSFSCTPTPLNTPEAVEQIIALAEQDVSLQMEEVLQVQLKDVPNDPLSALASNEEDLKHYKDIRTKFRKLLPDTFPIEPTENESETFGDVIISVGKMYMRIDTQLKQGLISEKQLISIVDILIGDNQAKHSLATDKYQVGKNFSWAGAARNLINYGNLLNQTQKTGELPSDAVAATIADFVTETVNFKHRLGVNKDTEIIDEINGGGSFLKGLGDVKQYFSGLIAMHKRDFKKAIESIKQVYDKAVKTSDYQAQVNALGNMGNIYMVKGDLENAEKYFKQAVFISKKLENKFNVSGMLKYSLGKVYLHSGKYEKAEKSLLQAVADIRKSDSPMHELYALNILSNLYYYLGKYEKALAKLDNLLDLAKSNAGKNPITNGLIEMNVISAHQNFSEIYFLVGQFQKAFEHMHKALHISDKPQFLQFKRATLRNLAVLHARCEQPFKAIEYLQQAFALQDQVNKQDLLTIIIHSLGSIYTILGQTLKHQSEQNIKQFNALFAGKPHSVNYYWQRILQQALKLYDKSLDIDQDLMFGELRTANIANLGFTHHKLGNLRQADKYLTQAVDKIMSLDSADNNGTQPNYWLANVRFDQGQLQAALKLYDNVLVDLETERTYLKEQNKLTYFSLAERLAPYDKTINVLTTLHTKYPRKNYATRAFDIFERKQGRVFLEQMGRSGTRRFSELPDEISQKEDTLVRQIENTQKSLSTQRIQKIDQQDKSLIKRLEQQLKDLETQQQKLQNKIQTDYPDYYALRYPKPATIKQLQNYVLKPSEIILVYSVLPTDGDAVQDITVLWLVSKNNFELFELPIKPAELTSKINAIYRVLAGQGHQVLQKRGHLRGRILQTGSDKLISLETALYQLYQDLIPKSIRATLKNKSLYIVPTNILYRLPFEALVTNPKKNHYLIEETAISYLSSASLLKIIRESSTWRKDQPKYPLLAFANPAYAGITSSSKQSSLHEQAYDELFHVSGLHPLPETAAEAKAIAQVLDTPTAYKTDISALQLGKNASKSRLLAFNEQQRLNDYRYLLFATHGVLTQVGKLTQPALALSDDYLTMSDIFGLKLNADFIMLSACNTGSGDPAGVGEGIRGLTGAFMYAGTPAVAVTLWPVETHSAKALSTEIFKQLHKGLPLAKAIQTAKLHMLHGKIQDNKNWQHPFFWAPFVSFGDGDKIIVYNRDNPQLIAALLKEVGYYTAQLDEVDWQKLKKPLQDFQRDIGFATTGKLSDSVWQRLRTTRLSSKQRAELNSFSSPRYIVSHIAALLAEVGYYSDEPEKASWQDLREPLKGLQKDLGLSQTGRVDDEIWEKLQEIKI